MSASADLELTERPIAELSRAYLSGEVTPSDVVEATLTNIERLEPKVGAFEIILAETAREAAAAATMAIRSGHRIGPFHGIPFALKDLVDVEGLVTTGGTDVLAGNVAAGTAVIARRLIAAGGILLGKTRTVEVAYGAWGTNLVRGTPWNPWDAETHRAPGGSSSGSGAAVAARMAACAVGTDTGGSVRLPASFCGIAGLKVTEGRLPLDGIVPLSHTLDTPGPMARTITDTAIMYEVMDGRHPADTDHDLSAAIGLFAGPDIAGLKLGALTADERDGIEPVVLEHYDAALDRLAALGARIVPFKLPVPIEHMKQDVGTIISAEGYFHHGDKYETPSNRMDTDVKPRIMAGRDISSRRLTEALFRRQLHKREVLARMQGIAALLTPTTAAPAPAIDAIDQRTTPATFTRAVNYLGFCASTVPMGLTSEGLPTGLQTVARGGDEAMALRIAGAFERDFGGIGRPAVV